MKVIVSVFDKKAAEYSGLYVVPSLAAALRSFGDSVARDQVMQAHPEDFELHFMGHFDELAGEISPRLDISNLLVGTASDVVRRMPRNDLEENQLPLLEVSNG